MKFANKLMIVPYNYSFEAPIKNYLSCLDQEMNDVLAKNIPDDQKLKLYNSILVKYKSNYDSSVYENQPTNIQAISSLIEDVKKETKELDQDLRDQYSNLNVKLEQIYEDQDFVTNMVKKDVMNKSKSFSKKTKKKTEPRIIKKAKRLLETTTINDSNSKKNKLENSNDDNDFDMEIETPSVLDTAMNKTKPLTTRKEHKEKEEARKNVLKPFTVQQQNPQLNLNKQTQQVGNGKIKWSTKKFF